MQTIKLNENEIHSLKVKYKSVKASKQKDKIRTVLLLNSEYSRSEISEILLIDEKTVTQWQNLYLSNSSLEDFLNDNYVSYNGKLTETEKKS